MNIESIAKLAHEINRTYCRSIGDNTQTKWANAPEWQKASAIKGVEFQLEAWRQGENLPPSASHESWLEEKRASGWVYGPVKDPDLKQHPCFVPYEALPLEQRMKDHLFTAVVRSALALYGESFQ